MPLSFKADTPAEAIDAMLTYCRHMYSRALDQQVGAVKVKDGQRWRGECLAYQDMIVMLSTVVIEPKEPKL